MEAQAALDNVVGKVVKEAEDEIRTILGEGLNEAEAILQRAEKEALAEGSRISSMSQRQAESRSKQIIGAAELEARNKTLRLLEEKIGEVLQTALKTLKEKKPKRYESSLKHMIIEGIESVKRDSLVVSCNKADRSIVEKMITDIAKERKVQISVSRDFLNCLGGVEVWSSDGSIRVQNTVEARVARMKADLRGSIAEMFQK